MRRICIILYLVFTSTASYVNVDESKDHIEPAAKHNCHKVNKKEAVDTTMCALQPLSREPLYGVNWNYTDPELSEMSKVKDSELFSVQIHYEGETHVRDRPKCVYLDGKKVVSKLAVVPGLKCNKQFRRYTAFVQQQFICGGRGFFVYFKIFANDTGCPLADLLADCSNAVKGPVSVAPKPLFAHSDPRDPCVGDHYFGLAIQIFDVQQPYKTSILYKTKYSAVGRFTVQEVERAVCMPVYEVEIDMDGLGATMPLEIAAVPVGTDLEIICTIKGQSHADPQLAMAFNGKTISHSFGDAYFSVQVQDDTAKQWHKTIIAPFNTNWLGEYVCSGRNPNGEVKKAELKVGTKKEVEDAIKAEYIPCDPAVSLHCQNGATCFKVPVVSAIACRCLVGWHGRQCQWKNPF